MKCLNCGKETSNPKFCSKSCSAQRTNLGRVHSEESRRKRRIALTGRIGWSRGLKLSPEIVQKRLESYSKEKRIKAAIKTSITLKNRWQYDIAPLVELDHLFKSKGSLRRFLIEKDNSCRKCGISEWCSKEITLEVHHIDGNKKNNRLSNVTLLCPNCHSQTHNFRSKNRKAGMAKQENALALKAGEETLAGSCPATSTKLG